MHHFDAAGSEHAAFKDAGWRHGRAHRDPGWVTRTLSRLRSRSLDQALGDGADPTRSAQLAARAAQLTARSLREELADCLEQLVYVARQPPQRHRVGLRRSAVLANTQVLREIARLLHGPTPVYARGMAITYGLLTDGTGPLFHPRSPEHELAETLRLARAALFDYDAR